MSDFVDFIKAQADENGMTLMPYQLRFLEEIEAHGKAGNTLRIVMPSRRYGKTWWRNWAAMALATNTIKNGPRPLAIRMTTAFHKFIVTSMDPRGMLNPPKKFNGVPIILDDTVNHFKFDYAAPVPTAALSGVTYE